MPKILLSKAAIPLNAEPGLFNRLATAHNRLPNKFPGAAEAEISRTTWSRCTSNPNKFRSIGPSSRCRMEQVAVIPPTGI